MNLNRTFFYRLGISLCLFMIVQFSDAQDIKWASEVIDVSSEYSSTEFGAPRALGEPDAMGIGTKRSNAWLAADISKNEFIMVAFDTPIKANQLIIAEAENPGAIIEVYLYDEGYYEYTHLEIEPGWVPDESRFFHQRFDETPFLVSAVKVHLDVTAVPGRNTIDAIGIANSESSIINGLKKKDLRDIRNFKAERMSTAVNSLHEENNPILTADGNRLYFSRQFDPGNVGGEKDPEDIWYSDRVGQNWSPAKNLGPPWNTSGPNFICSITRIDGVDHFLLGNRYLEKDKMMEGVSITKLVNGNFETPEPILIEDEYNYSNRADYYLVNENTLLMSVWRDEGFGDRDLYVSFRIGENWSVPKNLGPGINTFEEDASPQMNNKGTILYYSSKGYNGFGGFDVYMSERLDDTWENWSVPLNLGVNVNGGGDESYFSMSQDELDKFYSRGDTLKPADIYHISLRPTLVLVSGQVLNASTGEPVSGAIVNFQTDDGREYVTVSDPLGRYESYVAGDATWVAAAEFSGYRLVSRVEFSLGLEDMTIDNLLLEKLAEPEEPNEPILATSIDPETGETYTFSRYFYDLNSADIRSGHYSELQNLAMYLTKRPNLKVEVHGHADSRSTDSYNLSLSERRAKRVAQYLMNYGIDASRIALKGFGESMLTNDCGDDATCSGNQHQANRRTEIRIIGD